MHRNGFSTVYIDTPTGKFTNSLPEPSSAVVLLVFDEGVRPDDSLRPGLALNVRGLSGEVVRETFVDGGDVAADDGVRDARLPPLAAVLSHHARRVVPDDIAQAAVATVAVTQL